MAKAKDKKEAATAQAAAPSSTAGEASKSAAASDPVDQFSKAAFAASPAESSDPRAAKSGKRITLKLNQEGTAIDWSTTGPNHKELLTKVASSDVSFQAFLENAMGGAEPTHISDAMVMLSFNTLMFCEALVFAKVGPRVNPVLDYLPTEAAIEACYVSLDEMKPVLPEAKRLAEKYMPNGVFKYQDELVVMQHFGKISLAKFQHCVALAEAIREKERRKGEGGTDPKATAAPQPVTNGHLAAEPVVVFPKPAESVTAL